MTNAEGQIEPPRRPGWVWAISLFYLFSALFTGFGLYAILTHMIPLQPAQQAYFAALTPLDNSMTALIVVCNLSAALSLFLLRKIAVPLFIAGLAVNLAQTAWHTATKGWLAAMGSSGPAGFLIGIAMALAVIVYAVHLSRRGVLR